MESLETRLFPLAEVLEQYVPVKKSIKGYSKNFSTNEDIKIALQLLIEQINETQKKFE